ncbi:hypothetical protein BOO92_13925 [Vibrio navarrensis]|uniref:hypothetical protein n=1 Tax=Vibrio navarrensis TaxID=29495 RepID=UPI00186656E0|nr:hypothetical protein [Vibrio navarrensis]MBE3657775.1 hypothetical protein [Vibrio navarrensis]HDY8122791.1 hypothetical protein [Vibrio vulnificus]
MNKKILLAFLSELKQEELEDILHLSTHSLEKDWGVEQSKLDSESQHKLHAKLHQLLYPKA